jgi:hypothetical protein
VAAITDTERIRVARDGGHSFIKLFNNEDLKNVLTIVPMVTQTTNQPGWDSGQGVSHQGFQDPSKKNNPPVLPARELDSVAPPMPSVRVVFPSSLVGFPEGA